jgi:hypothetical protein
MHTVPPTTAARETACGPLFQTQPVQSARPLPVPRHDRPPDMFYFEHDLSSDADARQPCRNTQLLRATNGSEKDGVPICIEDGLSCGLFSITTMLL